MDAFIKDVRYGARMLVKNPGSTGIAIVALALGIGLTAMMFSIVHAAILRGLPFENADQLIAISRTNLSEGQERISFTQHDYQDYRAQQQSFVDIAGYFIGTVNVSGIDRPERFDGAFVSPQMFSLLGQQPLIGRTFTPEDGEPGAPYVMLLGYDTWQTRFGGDASVVGQVVRANGRQATIVGVMPPGFAFPVSEQVWVPLQLDPAAITRGAPHQWVSVFGRLRDGVTLDAAVAEFSAIAARLEAEYPDINKGIGVRAEPYVRAFMGNEIVNMLYTMLGAVFMVLLIACANVANLLISRATARTREVGIRTAMGASGIRIVRQFLTESFILSVSGALLGLLVAYIGIRIFDNAVAPTNPPFWIRPFGLYGDVLLFVGAITLLSSLLAGAIPAWQASRSNVADVLKDESRGSSSFRLGRISRALVVTEIALSAGLLVGAGLMIKSVTQVRNVDFAFRSQDVFTARIGLPEVQYSDAASQRAFFDELLPKLRELPAVEAVGLIQALPALGAPMQPFGVEGATYDEDRNYPMARTVQMSPGALAALDVTVLQGRDFQDQDREGALPVAIINQSMAQRYFEGQDPIGRRVRLGNSSSQQDWRTIVGIVPDMYLGGLDGEDNIHHGIYVPLAQSGGRFMSVLARTRSGDAMTLTQPVRETVLSVDSDLPIYFVQTLRAGINDNYWFFMVFGSLFMVFGAAALFLASVGLYGVMATSVSQRTREMGVRMALGAEGHDVLKLVMKQGLVQLAIGLTLGLALALGVSNLLQMILFQVNPRDPMVFIAIGAVLALTAAAACFVPANRATRVDPLHALRYD
jgi:putative ABC transport system permease protein